MASEVPIIEPILRHALAENHIHVSAEAFQQLCHYLTLLNRWNRVYNLTTITNPRDMVYLHIIDSLAVLPFLRGRQFLDIGTGAGLPGIPLAIVSPHSDQQWTLLDKTAKKTRFLSQVVAELSLPNMKVIQSRCEDFNPPECFDTILARAFSSLTIFVDLSSRLLCEDGTLIAMKGKYPQQELQALPNHYSAHTTRLMIKGVDIERHIVQIKLRSA